MGKLVKRARSFLRWRATLRNLQSALPDASADDISSFADDCAICKVSSRPSARRLRAAAHGKAVVAPMHRLRHTLTEMKLQFSTCLPLCAL